MHPHSLFSVVGIEIEYMLVDCETLAVKPVSDRVLQTLGNGVLDNEIDLGDIAVSNELVLHVLELKNSAPCSPASPIARHFQEALEALKEPLDRLGCRLLPGGAHPLMNPLTETRRWPHGNRDIYLQYDTIFDCRGHGWSNLQSMHVNLPYAGDEEFCRLHSAIRLILPLLPALAASTPFLDGKNTGFHDARLAVYATNQQKIPSITGGVIPDFSPNPRAYTRDILTPMYADISPYDPKGILQHSWLNSRGVIPKFDCNALEIRILDTQECVAADIGIAEFVFCLLKHLVDTCPMLTENPPQTARLRAVYEDTIRDGLNAEIHDTSLFEHWGVNGCHPVSAREVLSHWFDAIAPQLSSDGRNAIARILQHGNLAERLLRVCGQTPSREALHAACATLADCLAGNRPFLP
ncbi:Glutamate--cysteine ligase, GCS2 [Legionella geestiana]|uniref:Glutamate--cysteine ligase, GCS2 n=1 Tax=Legionella geestiana TaxID=45065 RepID=A0A0W0U8E8_9GAMM|nr:glutamate-cysteine ligase family protein [Legionella geestiana]KTD04063.1 Glutamate--cysteine ligase, GCS2 [Legionella geestiana]STX53202.1 Glutamate--cysteine ligase, GCS2 [Legionella geestiana]